jgi:hypothetical protein
MLREAAEAVGTSQFILRKLIQEGPVECAPSKYAQFGKTKIYLYTREDIEDVRRYLAKRQEVHDHNGPARKPGRPPKYTKEQRRKRARLYSKAWYWKNRAQELADDGDIQAADAAMWKVKQIEGELKGEDRNRGHAPDSD